MQIFAERVGGPAGLRQRHELSFARRLYDGRYHEREFGRSFYREVVGVREVVILKFVDRGNEV